jgi:tetratricopeptide (TPR) repeat protein
MAPSRGCGAGGGTGAGAAAAVGTGTGTGTARVVIVALVLATFGPLVRHDFGGFDDDMNVARNPHLNPPDWRGVGHYWRTPEFDLYVPFTYTVWSAAARVAWLGEPDVLGRPLNPYVFHLVNVLLHALAALIVFEVVRRCVRDAWPACAGALAFALHPVQVEPVGWVAGMKDVLAGTLALAALWQYLRAGEASTRAAQLIAWTVGSIAFVLAMLSKPGVVVLPAIALVIDWLVMGRSLRRAVLRTLPWLALAVPCAAWTRIVQPAPFIAEAIPLWFRPLIATDALAFYVYKLVWPLRLGVDYGRTPQLAIARGWIWWTWALPLVVGVGAGIARRRAPALTAAALTFLIGLAPVLGIIPFDFQAYSTVADHYLYLAMLGPALAVAWLAAHRPRPMWLAIAFVVLAALSVRAIAQARYWRDAVAIFEHAIDVNPASWAAHARLAEHWAERSDYTRAIEHGRRAVALNPQAWPVHRMLGDHLARAGEIDVAVAAYRAALALRPDDAHANTNLANLLAERHEYAQAIAHYNAALRSVPYSVIVHTNLASVLEEVGRHDDAISHYQKALEFNPSAADARAGLERARRAAAAAATRPASP